MAQPNYAVVKNMQFYHTSRWRTRIFANSDKDHRSVHKSKERPDQIGIGGWKALRGKKVDLI